MSVHIGKSELYVDENKELADINISISTINNLQNIIIQNYTKLNSVENIISGKVQTDDNNIKTVKN